MTRHLYHLRYVRSVPLMRRAIIGALAVLGLATIISIFSTSHLFELQEQFKRSQHRALQQIHFPVEARQQVAGLEESTSRESTVIQSAFYIQSALTVALLLLCYLYFLGDRAERQRQERKLRLANRRLSVLAELDGLTELKNRRAFEERLLEEWERSRRYGTPLSLLMIDVDHFKRYNDSFGHLAGDIALKMAAEILRVQARRNDFPARYGGEEFAVLLPHTGAGAALVTAERIRAAFLATNWPLRPVTVSVGVATVTADIASSQQLVNEADLALYYAKHEGRNRVMHIRDTAVIAR